MTTNNDDALRAFVTAHPFANLPNRAAVYLAAATGLDIDGPAAYAIADDVLDLDAADFDTDNDAQLAAVASAMFTSDDDYDDFRLELREALDMLDDDDRAMLADDDD